MVIDLTNVVGIADVEHYLVTYADFEEARSVARANAFVTLAKRWLILRADSASNQGSSLTIGKSFVETMMKRAQDFVAGNAAASSGASSRVRFLSSEGFR